MSDSQHVVLFLAGCIFLRLVFAAIVGFGTINLNLIGALALLPVLGWLYIIFVKPRDFGVEVGRIWWQHLRPFHLILWLAAAVFAFGGERRATALTLFADAIFGFVAWFHHYYVASN